MIATTKMETNASRTQWVLIAPWWGAAVIPHYFMARPLILCCTLKRSSFVHCALSQKRWNCYFVCWQAPDAAQLSTGGILVTHLLRVVSGSCRGHRLLVTRRLDHWTIHTRDNYPDFILINLKIKRPFIPGARLSEWCTTRITLFLIILSVMEWNVWQINSIYAWENPGSYWCAFKCGSTFRSRPRRLQMERISEVVLIKLYWRIQMGGREGLKLSNI